MGSACASSKAVAVTDTVAAKPKDGSPQKGQIQLPAVVEEELARAEEGKSPENPPRRGSSGSPSKTKEEQKDGSAEHEETGAESDDSFEAECGKTGTRKEQAQAAKIHLVGKGYMLQAEGVELDHESAELFAKVLPGEGDEFMAVKPWLGAIKEPIPKPKVDVSKPKAEYEIDWVYGYRSEEARMNLFLNDQGEAVYPTAALGVIYDFNGLKQKYFGGGATSYGSGKNKKEKAHTDDVTALCVNSDRTKVATGQNGPKPLVFVWNSSTAEFICQRRVPKGGRLVSAIGFSNDDKHLAVCDMSEKIIVHIFDLGPKGPEGPIADVQIGQKVMQISWSPNDANMFATVGKDHMIMCTLTPGAKTTCSKKKATMKGGKFASQSSIAWTSDGKTMFTGGADGNIYSWNGVSQGKSFTNCKGAVHSLAIGMEGSEEYLLAGGNDKTVTIYKVAGSALTKSNSITIDAVAKSLDFFKGAVLAGLKNGNIQTSKFEAKMNAKDTQDITLKPHTIMSSHCDGECWGLEVIHLENGEIRVLTSADDNRILAYDLTKRGCLAEGAVCLDKPAKKKKPAGGFKGGASSMSSQPAECQSRCMAYRPNQVASNKDAAKHLAVASNDGKVTIRDIDWAKVDAGDPAGLNTVIKTLFGKLKKAEWIEFMSYSPDEEFLGVGSHDNTIYLMNVNADYSTYAKLSKHSSFITAFDWSLDSKWIRSVCGAYELLFWNVGAKKQEPSGASNTRETVWASHSCKLGWHVQGIFPAGCDGSHVNSVCQSTDRKLLVTGDDWGLVNIFRNPALDKHECQSYRGHSEHVTQVEFSDDDKYILSTGGQDQTTIQWKRK